MGKTSAIEWTDATWNPWYGCIKVSAGCRNCYMYRQQQRYGGNPSDVRRSKTRFYPTLTPASTFWWVSGEGVD
jgi:protein gp37